MDSETLDKLIELHKDIGQCDKCDLEIKEYGTFLPVGAPEPKTNVIFIGAMPSSAADRKGKIN